MGFLAGCRVIGGVWLTGEFDKLETVLAVRLGRVDGVENPDDDDGAGMARLSRIGGIRNADDEDGVGSVIVCRRFAARFALSIWPVAAFCCSVSRLVVMTCNCFSLLVGFLLVASFAV